ANKSAATKSARAVSSATITTSVGPAIASIPTTPNTIFFAAATYLLPGPVILSTRGTVSVPNASAAIACAPPTAYTSLMFSSINAAATAGFSENVRGGVVTTIRSTPATCAGTTFITTDEGYAAVPPGTYKPTRSRGVMRWPSCTPSLGLMVHDSSTWRS